MLLSAPACKALGDDAASSEPSKSEKKKETDDDEGEKKKADEENSEVDVAPTEAVSTTELATKIKGAKVMAECVTSDLPPDVQKTLEQAKNMVGAMSRMAVAAYERETLDGPNYEFCPTVTPVPADGPPTKTKHTATAEDYETGGWKCLMFAFPEGEEQHFQFGYTSGGDYLGVKKGLDDPGANGFEAWAVGDLDGDGEYSLLLRRGTVKDGKVEYSSTFSCVDPGE